jgi:hypothetical protein
VNKDIDDIQVSSRKIASRGQRIEAVEFADGEQKLPAVAEIRPAPVEPPGIPELPLGRASGG